jgi:hypothetical protein
MGTIIGMLIGMLCEMLGGHWLTPWVPFACPEHAFLDFEHAQCKGCRQWYIRPRRLGDWPPS